MLSICIPYYSGLRFLEDCLRSIELYPPATRYEVLVVDDASPEPCASVANRFHNVRVLVNDTNVGFAASANRAVGACRGEQVLFLNPDTFIRPGAIARLQEHLSDRSDVAAVGPMILNEDGSFQPQCKRGRLTPASALGYALKIDRAVPPGSSLADYLRPGDPTHRATDVEALSGACMLVARRALDDVGGFDESLFLYGEDLDLCYRFRDAGWKVRYVPEATIVHVGGEGGTTIHYLRSLYHYHRSTYIVLERNTGAAFLLYGWTFALGFGLRFGWHAAGRLFGGQVVGSPKANGPRPAPLSPTTGTRGSLPRPRADAGSP